MQFKSLNRVSLFILLLFSSLSVFSQTIPEGYYNTIDGKQGRLLKTALHKVLKDHTVLRYNDMWYYYRETDAKANGVVWDMYSNTLRYFREPQGQSTSGMQREHSLPKSWWALSGEVDNYDAYTDLNHLYPSDGDANQAKSNYVLGEIGTNISFNNGVSKIGKNAYSYTGSPSVNAFEPADEYKGDFARTYFYMITCYEDYAQQWRSDGLNMFNKETYPVLQPWAKDMLLKWHRNDPVSTKEINRNEKVYIYQNNRNPFIDFPELVEYLWGNKVGEDFKVPDELIAKDPTLVTPTNLSTLYFGEIQKGSEVAKTLIFKGVSLKSSLSVMLWKNTSGYFSISTKSVPASAANSENGYALEITYNPKEYGEHSAQVLITDGGMSGSTLVYLEAVCTDAVSVVPVGADFSDLYVQDKTIFYRSYASGDKLTIYNVSGQVVFSGKCTGEWQSFKSSKPGIYLVRLNNKTRKMIVN